jgi:hypothetical protein
VTDDSSVVPRLACVILAHADPVHLRRLIEALEPFPIFLHVDARTPDSTFAAMTADLPSRCTVLKRVSTPWAQWGIVAAELEGYRAALDAVDAVDATHIALLSGSDYPLASAREIVDLLEGHVGESFVKVNELPYEPWGWSGGFARLRFRHWGSGKWMFRFPLPRRLPPGMNFTGGPTSKVLAWDHARAVVQVADEHPELVRFWRRSWSPDETFVYSILNTPRLMPDWKSRLVPENLWWIGWDGRRHKSPPLLDVTHREILLERGKRGDLQVPVVFARKFSTSLSTPVLDAIDARFSLRSQSRLAKEVGSP